MKQYFIGIDYSYTSPAITIIDQTHFKCFALNHRKKFSNIISNDQFGIFMQSYDNIITYDTQFERYEKLSEWCISIILTYCQEPCNIYIGIEGYSLGSRNGFLFNIAENTAILKYKLLQINNIKKIIIYPPTTIKKMASGKGNANKIDMGKAFFDQYKFWMHEQINLTKPDTSPSSDIVDSIFLARKIFDDVIHEKTFKKDEILKDA